MASPKGWDLDRVGYVHAILIEIAAGNLEGPCTTKVRRRIAYAHRHAGKVYGKVYAL